MSLIVGTRLGVYEVTGTLGVGGMGEVYRAHDGKLGRAVALKVLPEAFASDPDRLARFEREARTLASLNHPHIAQIYGLEEYAGSVALDARDPASVPPVRTLVMELVEGPTLAERIADGAVPLDEALSIAQQVADALEAAHDQGIVHRDLKPANIKVRPDGTVKVLDFGLAKVTDAAAASLHAGRDQPYVPLSQSPTVTSPALLTGAGMILGTAAYMSPEQAKGRPADARSATRVRWPHALSAASTRWCVRTRTCGWTCTSPESRGAGLDPVVGCRAGPGCDLVSNHRRSRACVARSDDLMGRFGNRPDHGDFRPAHAPMLRVTS